MGIDLKKENFHIKPSLEEIRKKHPSVRNWNGEIVEQKLIHETVRPGDRILEFGANIGRSSIVAAECTGPNGYVRSFESNEIDREKAKNNAKPLTNIEFMPAVSDVPLFQKKWDTSTVKHDSSWNEVDVVPTTMLNGHWDVIIVDCEGCFSDIILNRPEILKNTRALVFENDDSDKERQSRVHETLNSMDFMSTQCVPLIKYHYWLLYIIFIIGLLVLFYMIIFKKMNVYKSSITFIIIVLLAWILLKCTRVYTKCFWQIFER